MRNARQMILPSVQLYPHDISWRLWLSLWCNAWEVIGCLSAALQPHLRLIVARHALKHAV